jgi:uroporphyrinogen decarboxylase
LYYAEDYFRLIDWHAQAQSGESHMNPRERVLTVLRHEQPDRVPKMVNFYPWSFPQYPDQEAGEIFDTEIRFVTLMAPRQQADFLRYLESLPSDSYIGTTSILRTYHDWSYHPEIPRDAPLRDAHTVEQIAAAPLPNFIAQVKLERLKTEIDALHARHYAVMASPPHLGGELFETAWRLRGFEQFMIDLVENPPLVLYLLEQLTAIHIPAVLALTRSGIDILGLDDDVADMTHMLISPEMWRLFFKPYVRTIIEVCRRANPDLHILWHSDGNIEPIIPDLIEIGVDILNPVQPDAMNPAKLKQQFGHRLTFWGTVGTPQRWAWARPDEIREEVCERIRTVGAAGGLIISPAYDLEPEFKWENVVAFFQAIEEFGAY